MDETFLQVAKNLAYYVHAFGLKVYLITINSNLAYALIGNCLVERFYSDLTYDQYVQKFILAPLGMTQTGFSYTSRFVYVHADNPLNNL